MNIDFININQRIYLQAPSDITASEEVLSWFEQINQPAILDKKVWWECQTLLIEGFINIVEHAHNSLPSETLIDLEVIRFNEHIEIRIWSRSNGEVFDLDKKLSEISEFDDNFDERGRGLKIMSEIADKVTYEAQDDNRCCLFMSKKI
ncbi:ATP-binding protein [Calothrix sp. PCC 6303]|uniref:ATP-binding protein n=1 Tax=Calothrix sp. PCC 6303 TaxID=1170562 RepID=UPI0002A02F54|nr:anti-sigma regulatory factor [Calothrix sp. PCC 6303]AFZ03006.1 putative anti-sigma regulatory factor, serine/threonine protein kinase [Calothrix sp. PCC 6303]